MKKLFRIFTPAFLIIAFACNDLKTTYLPKEIVSGNKVSERFFYDSQKKLIKYQFGEGSYYTFDYNSQNLCIYIKCYKKNEAFNFVEYQYDSQNRLSRINEYDPEDLANPVLDYYFEFEYDEEGNIAKQIEYEWTCFNGFLISDSTIFQYDRHGNIVKANNYSVCCGYTNVQTYKYDDKINPYSCFGLQFFDSEIICPNNKTYYQAKDENAKIVKEVSYQYTYNNENLPVEVIQKSKENEYKYSWIYQQ